MFSLFYFAAFRTFVGRANNRGRAASEEKHSGTESQQEESPPNVDVDPEGALVDCRIRQHTEVSAQSKYREHRSEHREHQADRNSNVEPHHWFLKQEPKSPEHKIKRDHRGKHDDPQHCRSSIPHFILLAV